MDGITEDSPLAPVLLIWDYAERLTEAFGVQYIILWVAVHTLLFGVRRDLVIPSVLLSCWNHALMKQLVLLALSWKGALTLLVTALATSLAKARLNFVLAGEPGASWSGPAKPYFIPCRTTHARFFPKKHSFSYSYLLVGVPVGCRANVNGMLSMDFGNGGSAWYDVDPADYLQRGSGHLGFRGKLDSYLVSQGVDPSDYPHAYLLTAARFLGYHFNPVSFWYLYSRDRLLSAIILEVNNTFGERRPYLVLRDFESEARNLPPKVDRHGHDQDQSSPRARIKSTWKKDFHVSPFNSRNGAYSLLASDPLGANLDEFRDVDITINLTSSKGQPKLVARLFSESNAIDPSSMTVVDKASFLLRWFWVGFVTFPRIAKEAFRLFFSRGLHVWYRPEPLKDSMGRHADAAERSLETVFRCYLRHLVEHAMEPITVTYTPSGIPDASEETFRSAVSADKSGSGDHVHIKILTPAFYTRFIGYAHDFEAIFCELAESCTIWADKPDLLPKIFLKKPPPPLHTSSVLDFILSKIIKRLRQRPPAIKHPMTSAEAAASTTTPRRTVDIRLFRMSAMDAFVLGQENSGLARTYQATAMQVFAAQRFFFGHMEAVRILCAAGRLGLSAALAATAMWALETLLIPAAA